MLTETNDFTCLIVTKVPYAPEFISAVANSPKIFDSLFERYLEKASSSQWVESNSFARAAEAMDRALADATTDEQAFALLAAIVRGAEWKGNGPASLANNAFNALPALKAKATAYAAGNPVSGAAILVARHLDGDLPTFIKEYLA